MPPTPAPSPTAARRRSSGTTSSCPGPTGVICLDAITGATDLEVGRSRPVRLRRRRVGPVRFSRRRRHRPRRQLRRARRGDRCAPVPVPDRGYTVTSVAESDGNFYVASGSGFLYDFGLGGTPPAPVRRRPPSLHRRPAAPSRNPDGSVRSVAPPRAPRSGRSTWPSSPAGRTAAGGTRRRAPGVPGSSPTPPRWGHPEPRRRPGRRRSRTRRRGHFTVQASATGTDGLADLTAYSSVPSPPGRPSP